jgi:hypothetical protein
MLFAARKCFENDLTRKYLASKASWPCDVRDILVHSDFLATLRALPDCYSAYILTCEHRPVAQLLDLALLASGSAGSESLSALATRALAQRKSDFLTSVVRSEAFGDGIAAFLGRTADWRKPVTVGHFAAIFVAGARCDFDRVAALVGGLPAFLAKVVAHIDVLGWQDFLALLLLDFPANWVGSEDRGQARRGFASLGSALRRAADSARWPIVIGLLNALLSFVKEGELARFDEFVFDVDFVAALTEVTFAEPEAQPLAFMTGVDLITRIMDALEHPVEEAVVENADEHLAKIRPYLAAYGASFRTRYRVSHEQFEDELGKEQEIVSRAFPVLWDALLEEVYPCFFRNTPVSSDFNIAFLTRITNLERKRLVSMVPRLVECLQKNPIVVPGSVYVQNTTEPVIATNPQVALLVEYLAEQPHILQEELENVEEMKAWDQLSVIVVEQLLPLREHVPKEAPLVA